MAVSKPDRLLAEVQGNVRLDVSAVDFHHQLLVGLRDLIGCDGAAFRPGSRWVGSNAYYLDGDRRFTDGYIRRADVYRPEVADWCELSKGSQAFIDTELYSVADRSKKALYAEVIEPCKVKSIMGCPLSIDGEVVAMVLLFRTGQGRPFQTEQARALNPILSGLAAAELAMVRPRRRADVFAVAAALPDRLRLALDLFLTGKTERDIAKELGLSARTVHKYAEHIYRAFGVNSRPELMALFVLRPPLSFKAVSGARAPRE